MNSASGSHRQQPWMRALSVPIYAGSEILQPGESFTHFPDNANQGRNVPEFETTTFLLCGPGMEQLEPSFPDL